MRALKPLLVAAASLSIASSSPPAQAWISFLDFTDSMFPPDPPWAEFFNEGSASIIDLGGGNMALRMDSPDHSSESPPEGTYYNEYYVTDIPGYEKVGAARFRLESFTPTGEENLLAVSSPVAAPTITLVDGNYWLWSYLSDEPKRPILDLGPAVPGEFHEVYIMTTVTAVDDLGVPTAGGAKVWWDGALVYDAPVDSGGSVNAGGYVEFGSGTYWQVNAGTVVDFDWVGFGDASDVPDVVGLPGDFNRDFVVDAADYVVWRKNGGSQLEYNTWKTHFGRAVDPFGAGRGAGMVPEPAAILLFVLLAAGFAPSRFKQLVLPTASSKRRKRPVFCLLSGIGLQLQKTYRGAWSAVSDSYFVRQLQST